MVNIGIKIIGVVCLVLASSAWAERPWPETVFDCQVMTQSGTRGLVSIQTFSLGQANSGAIGKMAVTTLGTRENSVSVTECVERGTAEFRDASFQHWLQQLES